MSHWWPIWGERARKSRTLGPYRRSEDVVRDVQLAMAEKFLDAGRPTCAQLEAWLESHPTSTLDDWMRIAQSNVMRSTMRARLGRTRGFGVTHLELSECDPRELGAVSSLDAFVLAGQAVALAERKLPSPQRDALRSWLTGAELDTGEAAMRPVRAGLATLRRALANG